MSELHSFGGSAMDRYVFDYEAVEDAPAEGGVEAGADLSPAPETGETDASAVATDTAPAWTPAQLRDDPEFRDFLAEEAGAIAEARIAALQTHGAPPAVEQAPDDQFDPNEYLNPLSDNFGQNMLAVMQTMIEQAQAPYREQAAQQAQQESNARITDIITDIVSREGELIGDDVTDRIRNRARDLMPQVTQRYGMSDRAAEVALEQAYRAEATYQKQIREAALTEHTNRNAKLAGVHAEPGAASVPGVETRQDAPYREGELALKYGNRANSLREAPTAA